MPEQQDKDSLVKPRWLEEQHDIESLLHNVLSKMDKKPDAKPGFTLNQKLLPELFGEAESADLTWSLLQKLFDGNSPIFVFIKDKKLNHLDPEYTNGRIRFVSSSESLLRKWLNRPVMESELEQWKRLVEENKKEFSGDSSRLSARKIAVKGKSSEDIINGFIEIKEYLSDELTLRNLSARCFWQDSKFLDNREELITQLYPQLNIKVRPVLVSVYLPENIEGILFIENQDSYTQGVMGVPQTLKNYALVYSAGFKLSAQRIRKKEGVSLHFNGSSNSMVKDLFTKNWYSDNESNWPIYFWGDLDYSGMDILGNLKRRFESIEAWEAGYAPMLEFLLNGKGHTPEETGKQEQKDQGATGCTYADEKLLPALRDCNRFIDQEWTYK
ncbi:MAG: DUF2220 family protein [Woeseiaceae bacterium]